MESGLTSLLDVSINFETSHLFFPRIIHWVIAVLFVIILVVHTIPFLLAVKRGEKTLPILGETMDKFRFFGSLALIAVYFHMMSVIGNMFPYTGYGFLFVSIVFVFLMSLMYMHTRTRRKVITAAINAVVAPSLAWFVLAKLFQITLP
ncbi:tripartite tricarboxylate transporter TctB family protein [Halomonas sabkhae]|uniref:tripartite tricarboxylate transporter TctB family protein n=1 Tax=Halomonas sabkhae TaxID=626223 RepID=UPI0025B42CF7|nr:tripartite tricarboxylate transporter TctB family protein [Halomonas sabkhae]MDN3525771.1 tripartite tricarboxylate transporter TctB family protein [Halomonas sabkhae]